MGLTHYWIRPTELPESEFRAAVKDCRLLFQQAAAELGGFDGTGDPVLADDRIVFNGRLPCCCEAFEVAVVEFDRHGRSEVRSSCKTEHLPYDQLVKAALITLEHHLRPRFRVASDAKMEEWSDARKLTEKVLGLGGSFAFSRD